MTCAICTEHFTKVQRRNTICPNMDCGDKLTCKNCIATYIQGSVEEPHCLHCKTEYTPEWLQQNFPKTVTKKIESSQTSLRVGMLIAESAKPEIEQLVSQKIRQKARQKELDRIKQEKKDLNKKLKQLKSEEYELWSNRNTELQPVEKKEFIQKCGNPVCNGFVNNHWHCDICESTTCKDCHEIVEEEEHICNPSTLATVQLLKRDTKNCPGCRIPTHKIDGCNQMWCVQCHRTWDWTTGNIITRGNTHNPHYFAWLRQQNNGVIPRAPGDVVCGGHITAIEVMRLIPSTYVTASKVIPAIIRLIYHIEDVILRRIILIRMERYETDLQVRYVLNEITQEDMTSLLLKQREKFKITKLLRDLWEMYVASTYDIFDQLKHPPLLQQIYINNLIDQWKTLTKYCNCQLKAIESLVGTSALTSSRIYISERILVVDTITIIEITNKKLKSKWQEYLKSEFNVDTELPNIGAMSID